MPAPNAADRDCRKTRLPEDMGRGNLHAAGSRRARSASDRLRRISDRRLGARAQRTSATAPCASSGRTGRGRAGSGARGSRPRQKLTFHGILHLLRCANESASEKPRGEFPHITGRLWAICHVCAHCSIRYFADTRRERSLGWQRWQFAAQLSCATESALPAIDWVKPWVYV